MAFSCSSGPCGVVCMTVDIRIVRAGQMYRYYLRQTVVGDGRRRARMPLREAQEQAGVPAGRWMGRGLAVLGLTPGQEVTEAQLRNLFGERGRHPYADRIEADLLAKGESPKKAFKAGSLRPPGDGHRCRLRVPAAADDLPPVGAGG